MLHATASQVSSCGRWVNTGNGPTLQFLDIAHPRYFAVVDPNAAFWSLVRKDQMALFLQGGKLHRSYLQKRRAFQKETEALRYNARPLAVYFNPTERCNLNCRYCYIPEDHRRHGHTMSSKRLLEALAILRAYFKAALPEEIRPQVIFHGSEPMLDREAVFEGIARHRDYFRFGIQTNGTLLDKEAIAFLTSQGVGIGVSLDSSVARVADRSRYTWSGQGVYHKVVRALDALQGYANYNVICTVTRDNMRALGKLVHFLHERKVPVCMLNPVRCTRPGARQLKPSDAEMTRHYLAALDCCGRLHRQTGRKLVVANFANVLVALIAPAARRLMCDISPCGGGRCFFALSARGDLFPCSEFLGLPEFKGGNLFRDDIPAVLRSPAFAAVTKRRIEDIAACRTCAIRHFCGSPCPAEAYALHGSLDTPGAFCELYEEQVRYALRLIADGRTDGYLWDDWDKDTRATFDFNG